jgi:hypothetical protein
VAEALEDRKPVEVVAGEVEGSAGDHVDDEESAEADGVGVQAGLAGQRWCSPDVLGHEGEDGGVGGDPVGRGDAEQHPR